MEAGAIRSGFMGARNNGDRIHEGRNHGGINNAVVFDFIHTHTHTKLAASSAAKCFSINTSTNQLLYIHDK